MTDKDDEQPTPSSLDTDALSIETLLSIYPILSTLATTLPAGDLISLSRTSTTVRALTHGFPPATPHPLSSDSSDPTKVRNFLSLRLGNHQTPQWSALKSLAPFTCSSPFHITPKSKPDAANNPINVTKPCKFCSRPICRTCLIRSFFSDPSTSKNTFRYRTRYLCTSCWETGNLRRDFRYPCESISWEHVWHGRWYGQRGGKCCCSASEDNWLCRGCRTLQNISGPGNWSLWEAERDSLSMIERNRRAEAGDWFDIGELRCYGLGCTNGIDLAMKDRRRICLWCSKSLPRPFGGEDRLRWEEKQLEIRAAAAASRSADIQEWARNRFRSLTMSRREMRGTEECILLRGRDGREHDAPIFVRHLDACNYRQFMEDGAAPSPSSVYQSKNGRWVYSLEFMKRVDACTRGDKSLPTPAGADVEELFEMTKKDGLKMARRNLTLRDMTRPMYEDESQSRGATYRRAISLRLPRLHAAGIMSEQQVLAFPTYRWKSTTKLETLLNKLYEQLLQYEEEQSDVNACHDQTTFLTLLKDSGVSINEAKPSISQIAPQRDRPPEHTDADVPGFDDTSFETVDPSSPPEEIQSLNTVSPISPPPGIYLAGNVADVQSGEAQTHGGWYGQSSRPDP